MNALNQIAYSCDVVGRTPTLFMKGQTRFTSTIGLIGTIILFLSIMALLLYFLIDFFLGVGMTIIYSKESLDEDMSYVYNQKVFMIKYTDINGAIVDPRISSLSSMFTEYSNKQNTNLEPVKLEPCQYDKHFPRESNEELLHETDYDIDTFLCVTTDFDFIIYSRNKNKETSNFWIFITRCVNTTENNNHCLSDMEIDDALKNQDYFLSFVFEDTYINHFEFGNPFMRKIDTINKSLSFGMNYDYIFNWKKINYRSDQGFFYNVWRNYSDFQFDTTIQEAIVHNKGHKYPIPNAMLKFQITLFQFGSEDYQREFPKIQGVIVSMSGLINVIFIIIEFIVKVLSNGQYYSELTNSINAKNYANHSYQKLNSLKTPKVNNSILPVQLPKQTMISTCTSLKWIIAPKLNNKTIYLTKCKERIANIFSVENIILKLQILEPSAGKSVDFLNWSSSFSDLAHNCTKRPMTNNLISPINSFLSTKELKHISQRIKKGLKPLD